MIILTGSIILFWLLLTIVVQWKGPEKTLIFGQEHQGLKALLVYNPDRFYNLDEQVCTALANSLSDNGWSARIATVAAAETTRSEHFDAYVFCANTYNWGPDRPTRRFIKNHPGLNGSHVVAITLGSGSTQRSQRLLDELIRQKGAILLYSETLWLMKPNDESRIKVSNVKVALDKATALGSKISKAFEKGPGQVTRQ